MTRLWATIGFGLLGFWMATANAWCQSRAAFLYEDRLHAVFRYAPDRVDWDFGLRNRFDPSESASTESAARYGFRYRSQFITSRGFTGAGGATDVIRDWTHSIEMELLLESGDASGFEFRPRYEFVPTVSYDVFGLTLGWNSLFPIGRVFERKSSMKLRLELGYFFQRKRELGEFSHRADLLVAESYHDIHFGTARIGLGADFFIGRYGVLSLDFAGSSYTMNEDVLSRFVRGLLVSTPVLPSKEEVQSLSVGLPTWYLEGAFRIELSETVSAKLSGAYAFQRYELFHAPFLISLQVRHLFSNGWGFTLGGGAGQSKGSPFWNAGLGIDRALSL